MVAVPPTARHTCRRDMSHKIYKKGHNFALQNTHFKHSTQVIVGMQGQWEGVGVGVGVGGGGDVKVYVNNVPHTTTPLVKPSS